jgi:hypothetical protein
MPKPSPSGSTPISPDSQSYPSDTSEALQTLTVPTVNPITVSYNVTYKRALAEQPGLANLTTFDGEFWDDADGGEALVSARMEIMGPYSLNVESVKLIRHVSSEGWCTLPSDADEYVLLLEWRACKSA